MFDRITFDPQILGGRACIRGMRITVANVVGQIAHGATTEEFPYLEREDVQQALEYAARLTREDVIRGRLKPTKLGREEPRQGRPKLARAVRPG